MERRVLEQRKRQKRPLRPKTYIYCNGDTEKKYFEELRKFHRVARELCVIQSSQANRLSLVQEVEEARGSVKGDETTQVFVVFDADILPKGKATNTGAIKSQVDNAWKKCVAKGYAPILSNESFELWFLLHFEDVASPLHRDELLKRLKIHVPEYGKASSGMHEKTALLHKKAQDRARKLTEAYTETIPHSQRNPFTNVYELVAHIESIKK